MNNKEFISELSRKLGYTNKDTSQLVSSVIGVMTQELQDGNNIVIQGFRNLIRTPKRLSNHFRML